MDTTDTTVERGSGNVFADLGLPDADAHLVKAELVSRIDGIVRKRGITQTEAARLLGLSQPDVSRLLRGDFREYSLERLFRLLTALGAISTSSSGNRARLPAGSSASLPPKPAEQPCDPNRSRLEQTHSTSLGGGCRPVFGPGLTWIRGPEPHNVLGPSPWANGQLMVCLP